MIEVLDERRLASGEMARILLLTPPEKEYGARMLSFLRHKDDENIRSIGSRIDGKYADVCVDRYFVAEIGGRPAAQVWYGYGKHADPVANFGHVYTDPDFRRRGLIHLLMPYLVRDFDASPALGAFCTAGAPYLAELYGKYRFHPAHKGEAFGDLVMLRKQWRNASFAEFMSDYYNIRSSCNGAGLRIVPGSMRYRHEIDRLLDFSWRELNVSPGRCWFSNAVRGFQQATFLAEDGRGKTFVFLTPGEHVAGWAFCLNPFAPGDVPLFDWELHPGYRGCEMELIPELLHECVSGPSVTPVSPLEESRCAVLRAAGMREIAVSRCGLLFEWEGPGTA